MEGICRSCMRKRIVASAQRYGGGDYRRPHRHYSSSVCLECVNDLLAGKDDASGYSLAGRFTISSLRYAREQFMKWAEEDAAADKPK